ncbi:hypothetical protein PMAYCL1PPCAC_13410, partial [Pristionchus mayeri]
KFYHKTRKIVVTGYLKWLYCSCRSGPRRDLPYHSSDSFSCFDGGFLSSMGSADLLLDGPDTVLFVWGVVVCVVVVSFPCGFLSGPKMASLGIRFRLLLVFFRRALRSFFVNFLCALTAVDGPVGGTAGIILEVTDG